MGITRQFASRRRRRARRRAAVLTAAGAATAAALGAGGFVVLRRRRARRAADGRVAWTCACGQGYLVRGTDRHRIYWLPDAALGDPLLARACVACGAALPAGHETA